MDYQIGYPIQLIDVRLFEANIKRRKGGGKPSEEKQTPEAENIPLEIGLTINKLESKMISCQLSLNITGLPKEQPEFEMAIKLEGLFESQMDFDKIEKEIWDDFKGHSAISILWPYARECVQNFVHRMREDLPILPTLNRLNFQEKEKK